MVAVKLAEALVQQLNAAVGKRGNRLVFVAYEGSGHVLAMEQCRQAGRFIEKLMEMTRLAGVRFTGVSSPATYPSRTLETLDDLGTRPQSTLNEVSRI